jgi:hypothetical protein
MSDVSCIIRWKNVANNWISICCSKYKFIWRRVISRRCPQKMYLLGFFCSLVFILMFCFSFSSSTSWFLLCRLDKDIFCWFRYFLTEITINSKWAIRLLIDCTPCISQVSHLTLLPSLDSPSSIYKIKTL